VLHQLTIIFIFIPHVTLAKVLANPTSMKDTQLTELIALENLIQDNLQTIHKSLGMSTNNSIEVQELKLKPREVEPAEDKKNLGIFLGDQLLKLCAATLKCTSEKIKEIVTLNSAISEELEISQEQVISLKRELVAESQKIGFWQEEVEACYKEIEDLNIELQNYYQFRVGKFENTP
jgi:hypothetical protein